MLRCWKYRFSTTPDCPTSESALVVYYNASSPFHLIAIVWSPWLWIRLSIVLYVLGCGHEQLLPGVSLVVDQHSGLPICGPLVVGQSNVEQFIRHKSITFHNPLLLRMVHRCRGDW